MIIFFLPKKQIEELEFLEIYINKLIYEYLPGFLGRH